MIYSTKFTDSVESMEFNQKKTRLYTVNFYLNLEQENEKQKQKAKKTKTKWSMSRLTSASDLVSFPFIHLAV